MFHTREAGREEMAVGFTEKYRGGFGVDFRESQDKLRGPGGKETAGKPDHAFAQNFFAQSGIARRQNHDRAVHRKTGKLVGKNQAADGMPSTINHSGSLSQAGACLE